MRRTWVASLVLFVLLVVAACAIGCGGGGGRDVSTPSKALLGHWKNTVPGSKTEIYFSGDTATFKSGTGPGIPVHYTIISQDQKKFTLDVDYGASNAGGGPSTLAFSSDRNTLLIHPKRVPEVLRYSYVNSEQKPLNK